MDRVTRRIVELVSEMRQVAVEDILSPSRARHVVRARWLAIWCLKQLQPGRSLPAIGSRFGLDHTSVLYALRRVSELMERENEYREVGQALMATFERSPQAMPPWRSVIEPIWKDAELVAAAISGADIAFCAHYAGMPIEAARDRMAKIAHFTGRLA